MPLSGDRSITFVLPQIELLERHPREGREVAHLRLADVEVCQMHALERRQVWIRWT
jgi:hypothetical protein